MKNQIFNLGKILSKPEQKKVNGGNDEPNSRGCYEQPVADVECISPWVYVSGCGFTCMIAPTWP
ncbi:hypothetical protein P8625_06945 [Tenacibaculum tangerinum]|uniref:Uncharacterized protein n=1 Tax=Tenacibaculum tangerinum TaxID=3038772 RepID=A0ABY8L9Q2_9FLAO|nr:hypothetical protein [Tenacibaculum tangerinum]WGH76873.1 hypothetical protein P8625_06945 [Tenacibaculum tangerinum]